MGGIGEKKFNWLRQKPGRENKRHSRGGEEKFGYTRSTEHSMQLGSKNTKYLLSCTVGLS